MPHRASLLAVMVIALTGVAIMTILHREEAALSPALGGSATDEDNTDQPAVKVIEGRSRDSTEPAGRADGSLQNPDILGIEAFLELREVPVVVLRKDLDELAVETRDANWSTEMEARFQAEISRASLTLTDSFVECRTSTCMVALVRPTGAYDQKETVGLPNGPISRKMLDAGRTVGLLGSQASQILARNGALVHWQRFFRRCAPDWTCPR